MSSCSVEVLRTTCFEVHYSDIIFYRLEYALIVLIQSYAIILELILLHRFLVHKIEMLYLVSNYIIFC